jgi:predicted dehydrogenase/nucleoside-diphosphate-sugar epimerase
MDEPKTKTKLRIGLVGCGKVAEHHARFIKPLPNAELVAVTDFNLETARRFAEAHGIPSVRATLDELLDSDAIDVLHVITPPAYHYECAKAALDRGIHVFVEKPVAFTVREVTDLYDRAAAHGALLCPDYIQLFHPKMQELVGLVDSGQLGNVVHVETYLCINLEDSPEVLEAEGIHWSYRLPGGMLRDFTSHLLYMSFYFAGLPNEIQVSRNSRGALPQGLFDHLTVQIDGIKSTATVLLSCLPRPSAYGIRVRCEKGSAELNFETQTLVVDRQNALPRRIVAATANFAQSWKLSRQGIANILNFVRGKLVPYGGMRVLIPRFYDGILRAKDAPISRDLVTAVTLAEEQIFSGSPNPQFRGCRFPSAQTGIRKAERVLVTGGNGFVGMQAIKALIKEGYFVRAMIRPTASADRLKQLQVEVFLGDVRRLEDVLEAADGMQVILHLAAGMKGSPEFIVDTCARGTKNVAEAASSRGVKRVIYMSSFSVYDLSKLRDGDNITETSLLEEQPENRGAYTVGKRLAEDVALANLSSVATPWTILRPPVIVGHGHDIFSPVGSKVGNTLVCLGSPRKRLPLVHVEDVAAAIPQILQNNKTEGQVYILSNPQTITVRDYVESGIRQNGYPDLRVIYVPYLVARLGGLMAALLKKLTRLGPTINRRRLLSFYRDVGVNSTLLQRHTGWQSAVELPAGLNREAEERNRAEQVNVNQHVPVG